VGIPVTSQIVAANLRDCSSTHDEVARPRWMQYSS